MGAAYTSCGCGIYVHHVTQSWIMILMQTCHVQRHRCELPNTQVRDSTLHDGRYSLRDAFQCIAQPKTTFLDCILYLMQFPYDPGVLPSSVNYN